MNGQLLLERQNEIIKLISSGEELNSILKYILTSVENHSSSPQISGFIMTYDLESNKFSDMIHNSMPNNIVDIITSQVIQPTSRSSTNTNFFKKVMSNSNISRSYLWKDYTHIIEEHGIQSACSIPILSSENQLLGTLVFLSKDSINLSEDILKDLQPYCQLAAIAIAIEIKQKKMTNNENNKIYLYEKEQQFNRKEAKYRSMFTELTHALERMEFEIYYQPYFGVDNQSMGMEALIRWNHPQNGLMAPAEFLGVAEETGFILELEKWVLFQSLYEIKNLHEKGFKDLTLSVNISAKQLENKDFPDVIANLLENIKFDSKLLTLEITERFLIQRDNIKTLHLLKELGINLSIDDFGTAYSSLQYLKDFPVDEIKIDRSFIANLETNVTNQKIVAMIIILGHQLDMTVVAEGVETKQQYQMIKEMGCDIVQGYLFSRPVPLNTIKQNFFQKII